MKFIFNILLVLVIFASSALAQTYPKNIIVRKFDSKIYISNWSNKHYTVKITYTDEEGEWLVWNKQLSQDSYLYLNIDENPADYKIVFMKQ